MEQPVSYPDNGPEADPHPQVQYTAAMTLQWCPQQSIPDTTTTMGGYYYVYNGWPSTRAAEGRVHAQSFNPDLSAWHQPTTVHRFVPLLRHSKGLNGHGPVR